jgi:hypothetical protein
VGLARSRITGGNDYFDDTYERNGEFEKFEGYCSDVWFREGMRFIEENRSEPFLLYRATNKGLGIHSFQGFGRCFAEVQFAV